MNSKFEFNFGGNTASNGKAQISFTAEICNTARQAANSLLQAATTNEDLFNQVNDALDNGTAEGLFTLVDNNAVDAINEIAEVLAGADDDVLSRLLESRRSDRSKTKAKGLKSSLLVASNYIACGIAEQGIRKAWNKPYDAVSSNSHFLDESDLTAVGKKIKSLQSKKCRLAQLVKAGDASKEEELEQTIAEIDRLNALRPSTRTKSSVAIKADSSMIREALKLVDTSKLSEEEANKVEQLLKALAK